MLIRKVRWDMEADVVVVGYGAAGASAALSARAAGAEVVVLEKQEAQTPLTNSYMSGGGFMCATDVEAARMYMQALCQAGPQASWTDPDIVEEWARHIIDNKEWLEKMGAAFQLHKRGGAHKLPGAEAILGYKFAGMGPGMMRFFYEQVDKANIAVARGVRATSIIENSRGQLIGVATRREATHKPLNVRARRAIVLATGGFEFDEQTKLQYLKVYPCHFASSPWNTGDGIRMSLEVGAQLWHMNCCAAGCVLKFPELASPRLPSFGGVHWINPSLTILPKLGGEGFQGRHSDRSLPAAGYVMTDRYGKRYADENIRNHEFLYDMAMFDSKRLLYPRVPSYWIFDQKRLDAGALAAPMRLPKPKPDSAYDWSSDNRYELARGWIKEADTIRGLALKLSMEADTLVKTIEEYNACCRNGVDISFGREPSTLVPLETSPYCAVELWPGGLNTMGGPRRNSRGQILGPDDTPIPRLYSAGELGSIYGMLYPGGGGNIAECITFGRIAGENAAQSTPL